jgi:hypothetical protein
MNIRYEIIIYWSEEGSPYIAEVPELPGYDILFSLTRVLFTFV